MKREQFEEAVKQLNFDNGGFRSALIDVCDTAAIARKWLLDHYDTHTASDAIALTALVVAQRNRVQGDDE